MSPSDNHENEGEPLGGASAGSATKAGNASNESERNDGQDHREGPGSEPQSLGILFIAAAFGLALLLTIVGLLAAAAMSKMPPSVLGSDAFTLLSA
jgi:hypothetical protein